MEFFS
jgi:hypothetical protein